MNAARYSKTAMLLHWSIALALAFQISLGWRLEDFAKGPDQFWAYQLHKSIGITILLLTLLRVAIRWLHPRPALPADSIWAQRLAKSVHTGLYLVMLGGPLTGWAIVSTSKLNLPTLIFGVLPWPHLPLPNLFHEPAEMIHELLAKLAFGLFVLHVAGAVRHQFFRNDNLLGHMLPGLGGGKVPTRTKAGIALAAALAGIVGAVAWAKLVPPPAVSNLAPPVASSGNINPQPLANAIPPPAADVLSTIDPDEEKSPPETVTPLTRWKVSNGGELGFTTSWSGTAINGRFGRWDADIMFSPDILEKSRIKVMVHLASADTGDGQRDETMQSDSFFDSAVHPVAVFTAKRISHSGADRYLAVGTLSLHGQTHPATLRFSLKISDGRATVRGAAQLSRTNFGVGSGDYSATNEIPDQVSVSFSFTALAQTG